MKFTRFLLLVPFLVFLTAAESRAVSRESSPARSLESFPPIVLWAWERPEDLRFLKEQPTGVAFLAKTIRLHQGKVVFRPRSQPLLVAEQTPLMAVVRIEPPQVGPLPPVQEVAEEIVATTRRPRIIALQIDFDARKSERPFYRKLLSEVRRKLPAEISLSMTALASWCMGDDWLADLKVDEVVPMLFRMGPDRDYLLTRVSIYGFQSPSCSTSLGVSLDEPITVELPEAARRYYSSPAPWTPETVKKILSGR